MTARPDPNEPTLVVPDDLVVPASTIARLRRQYDRRPRGVVAIATTLGHLGAGSSVTTTAERASMTPLEAVVATSETEVDGAVLVQPGIDHVVIGRTVRVALAPPSDGPAERILVDPGALAFDPLALDRVGDGDGDGDGDHQAQPDPSARPPFRWRPVVLFLATEPDPDRARIAAELANELVSHDVEPRLALVDTVAGPLLTRPCSPSAASVAVLAPDIIVALDDDARDRGEAWSSAHRHTILVEVDADLDDRIELVPWTIGVARGRVRARIGDRLAAEALAQLVNRLCAGPVAGPPIDVDLDGIEPDGSAPPRATVVSLEPRAIAGTGPDLEVPGTDEDPRRRPSFAVSTGARASRTIAGLADHLQAGGHELVSSPTAPEVDLLLLDAELDGSGQVAIVEPGERAPRARRRVVVIDPDSDAEPGPEPFDRMPDGPRRRLDDTAGAITSSPQRAAHLRSMGLATIVLPRLRPRAALHALERAHRDRVRPAVTTVGIRQPSGARHDDALGSTAPGAWPAAVAAAEERRRVDPDLTVVAVAGDELGDADLAGWSFALWVPADDRPIGRTELDELVSLALAGVPVLLPAALADAAGSLADRTLLVDDPERPAAWAERMAELDDDDRRARAAARARRIGDGVAGAGAAALVIDRMLGWVTAVAP